MFLFPLKRGHEHCRPPVCPNSITRRLRRRRSVAAALEPFAIPVPRLHGRLEAEEDARL